MKDPFEKRKSNREDLFLACTVRFQNGEINRGFVTDLSKEGAFVESPKGASPEEMVVLSFKYLKEELTILCRVANQRPKRHTDGFGVYFVEFLDASLEAMHRLLEHRTRLSQSGSSSTAKAS